MIRAYSYLSDAVHSNLLLGSYQVHARTSGMTGTNIQRLLEAMTDRGFDQSSLAREVGCTPGAINQIVNGSSRNSRYMPEIARALKVNFHWLMGDDVPRDLTEVVPQRLPRAENDLIAMFRGLGGREQETLARVAEGFAKAATVKPAAMQLPDEQLLVVMFRALVRGIDLSQPLDDIAQLLARRLPIGLAQLHDVIPVERDQQDLAERASPEASPSMHHPAPQS
jgi:transcriptional regulator with XRE-family HTH domain